MKSLRCHWCNGPNGIVCGPKLNVCQKCRDKDCEAVPLLTDGKERASMYGVMVRWLAFAISGAVSQYSEVTQ